MSWIVDLNIFDDSFYEDHPFLILSVSLFLIFMTIYGMIMVSPQDKFGAVFTYVVVGIVGILGICKTLNIVKSNIYLIYLDKKLIYFNKRLKEIQFKNKLIVEINKKLKMESYKLREKTRIIKESNERKMLFKKK